MFTLYFLFNRSFICFLYCRNNSVTKFLSGQWLQVLDSWLSHPYRLQNGLISGCIQMEQNPVWGKRATNATSNPPYPLKIGVLFN